MESPSMGQSKWLSCREDKVSAFAPDPCVLRHLLIGRVIKALRENVKYLWALSNEKSSSPVLSPPSWQQTAPKTT